MPIPKALATLAIPTIVSQLITMIYNLADTFFIGSTDNHEMVAAASVSFVLFFVISGAELELSVFSEIMIILVGIAYIISRSLGKYSGAFASAKMTKCDDNIVKYLGITLLPQAGVALGMAKAAEALGPEGHIVASITLFAVLVYELIGPTLTKIALTKAGDIKPEGKVSARDEAAKKLKG